MIAYHVDSTGNHDACMQAFSDNGIYVFLDLDTFNTQIEETNPQWTYNQFTAFTAVIDAFAKYDNIAGFFVANEVCILDPLYYSISRSNVLLSLSITLFSRCFTSEE